MLDLIYPRNCISCGKSSPEVLENICWDCLFETQKVESPFCALCGDPVAGDIQHDYVCYACSHSKPAFDLARSAVRYEGVVSEALRQLKYGDALFVAKDLASLLYACVQAEYSLLEFDFITAVPLFPAKKRSRGFNQSEELGKALSKKMKTPFRANVVRRIRQTVSQTGLTAPQRIANVHGAFRIGFFAYLKAKKILLVDDVMSTGATVNACAKALKSGGAASVHVVTVARG